MKLLLKQSKRLFQKKKEAMQMLIASSVLTASEEELPTQLYCAV
jgi:hypothetical protein